MRTITKAQARNETGLFSLCVVIAGLHCSADSSDGDEMDSLVFVDSADSSNGEALDSAETLEGSIYPCEKQVEAILTFYDNTCWRGRVACNGVFVPTHENGESVIEICDNPNITCDEPEVARFTYTFEYWGETCEYCSTSDDKDVCIELQPQCGSETVSIVASGSEEGGTHPQVPCPDDR